MPSNWPGIDLAVFWMDGRLHGPWTMDHGLSLEVLATVVAVHWTGERGRAAGGITPHIFIVVWICNFTYQLSMKVHKSVCDKNTIDLI